MGPSAGSISLAVVDPVSRSGKVTEAHRLRTHFDAQDNPILVKHRYWYSKWLPCVAWGHKTLCLNSDVTAADREVKLETDGQPYYKTWQMLSSEVSDLVD